MSVGAPDGTTSTGYAAVYKLNGESWMQMGDTIAGIANGDSFGRFTSLSSDGSTLAVGAPAPTNNAGYVKVYNYSGGSWIQKGSTLYGEAMSDEFGICVSLSADGDRVAVGAFKSDAGNSNAGQVKIYDYSSDWTEISID